MKPIEKLEMIRILCAEIVSRYKEHEFNILLSSLRIPQPIYRDSFVTYVRDGLEPASDEVLLSLASDLQIDVRGIQAALRNSPQLWRNSKAFKLFISHLSQHKEEVHVLRDRLKRYAISAFVAHDDIEPTVPWQEEVERALRTMDAMVLFVAGDFSRSPWTQQEAGFALGRRTKVISFMYDGKEDPKGFLASVQAIPRRERKAAEVALEINSRLLASPETRDALVAAQAADLDERATL